MEYVLIDWRITMGDFINFLAFTWLTLWVIYAIVSIVGKGQHHSILVIMVVFYVFFAIPLFLDILFEKPQYYTLPGFRIASNDDTTSIVYCMYVSAVPVIWWLTGKSKKSKKIETVSEEKVKFEFSALRRFKPILYLLLISPIFALLFAPDPSIYLKYGFILGLLSDDAIKFHSIVSMSTLLSVLSAACLILMSKRINFFYLMTLFPFIFLSVFLNGKRAIVFIVILVFSYIFWRKGRLRGVKLTVYTVFIAGFLISFTSLYQDQLRYNVTQTDDSQKIYENVRVDYGRDNMTKMTIFAELNPNTMKILEYRGQSFLFDLTMYVPRDIWPSKPWPYSIYFTSAMLLLPIYSYGWGMTTSILEECIANFGWIGMILGPLFISFICRLGDSRRNTTISALTILIASLFLVVQLPAFAPVFLIWLILVTFSFRKKRIKTLQSAPFGVKGIVKI